MIEYTLNRSSRKSVAIYVRDGAVEVRAPLRMPKSEIDRFVTEKDSWIRDKVAETGERLAKREAFSLDYGDKVLYRGAEYPIVAIPGNTVGFDDDAFFMPPGLPPEHVIGACIQIYRLLAKRDLTDRVYDYVFKMHVSPTSVKINGAKKRWGSCSTNRSVNFSWHLVMADDDVIDYVVVHELAHLKEMNHSEQFWSIVGSMLPDYAERKARLYTLQKRLMDEGW
ncbi:MAG: M48 family metallopeptidase [Oscillospiraceae bacterium]|nr:M48 family metallopeptidase [Oscillospiraceae bacterium]